MIDAGLSINKSLKILAEQNKNPRFKKIINQVEKNVRQGKSVQRFSSHAPKGFLMASM